MRLSIVFLLLIIVSRSFGQSLTEQEKYIARFRNMASPPDGLVAGRAALMFSKDYSQVELEKIQKGFQQTGIDVVTYIESDVVLAGRDVQTAYATQFNKRNVKFLIFATKNNQDFVLWFMSFVPRSFLTNPSPLAWSARGPRLNEVLISIFRTLSSTQKRQNFLINDYPEMETINRIFANVRNESMISNLKNFRVALPAIGDAAANKELLEYFTTNFHGKFESTPDTITDRDLVQKGFRYVLRYIHLADASAKEILGYEVNKSESAIASTTYVDGNIQLKPIPSGTIIYKFYLKDLEDRNVYLGTKWDADVSWQDALKNHFDAYRVSGRLN